MDLAAGMERLFFSEGICFRLIRGTLISHPASALLGRTFEEAGMNHEMEEKRI